VALWLRLRVTFLCFPYFLSYTIKLIFCHFFLVHFLSDFLFLSRFLFPFTALIFSLLHCRAENFFTYFALSFQFPSCEGLHCSFDCIPFYLCSILGLTVTSLFLCFNYFLS
jgi:hypothetical protein